MVISSVSRTRLVSVRDEATLSDLERETLSTLRAYFDVWNETYDMEKAFALIDEDAVYRLYVDEAYYPFAGETRGKTALRATLGGLRETFDYLLFRAKPAIVAGKTVRHVLEFIYRHRPSGETLEGRGRMIWTVRNRLLVACDEYHDRDRLNAFARLTGFGAGE